MTRPPLILASTSRYRQALLEKLGIPFECQSPMTDETALPAETASELVSRLAITKAHTVAEGRDQGWVIGSDQVCVSEQDGVILGKPGTHAAAVDQLRRLAGHCITFYTGLCLYDAASQQYQVVVEPFQVHFRPLKDAQIERYLRIEQPYDCAGSFKCEGMGICLFERLDGRDPNALIGLPLIALTDMLAKWGCELPLIEG